MLGNHNSKRLAVQGWRWPPLPARGRGGSAWGCAASSYIPDPLSHPLPPPSPPPSPPPAGQAARAPALRRATREPSLSRRGRGCTRRRALLGTRREPAPAPTPGFPCAAPPWSHGLASTCWRLRLLAEPLPPPRRSPLRQGMGTLPRARSANPAGVDKGAGAGGRRLPGRLALQSAEAPRPRGDWVEGSLPLPPPPRSPTLPAEREGGVRPPPARLRWKPGLLAGTGRGC